MGFLKTGLTLPRVVGMEESVLAKQRLVSTDEGAKAIGQRLAAFRKARGLTQTQLAEVLGAKQAAISKYEKGDLLLHGQLIAQLATTLHVSADELLGVPRGRKAAHAPAPVVDKTLARRLAQLQQLPRRDREALLRTLDAYLSMARPRAA